MKKTVYLFAFWLILFFSAIASAQENQLAKWIRAQNDNGEFSVEVPAEYDFYRDKDGFLVSDYSKSYQLTEMRILNAFREKTLLSFEVYETNRSKDVADIFIDREEKNGEKSEIKLGELKIKQILIQKDGLYAVRRFLTSKTHLYVLTAASRNGETAVIKRFLDSVAFKTMDTKSAQDQMNETKTASVLFSALKVSQLEIDQNPEPFKKSIAKKSKPSTPIKDENSVPLSIIVKPNPSYTDAAHQSGETGVVRIRMTFSKNGSVTKIGFLSTLNGGLLRQVVFAAIRIKFLPAEKEDKAIAVTKILDYEFRRY